MSTATQAEMLLLCFSEQQAMSLRASRTVSGSNVEAEDGIRTTPPSICEKLRVSGGWFQQNVHERFDISSRSGTEKSEVATKLPVPSRCEVAGTSLTSRSWTEDPKSHAA
ncbi:hypothetical protein EB835_02150 [Brevibacterium sp. S22]|nr:hypothetical protein EB835_02150 [Brevibacterium sp. S22]